MEQKTQTPFAFSAGTGTLRGKIANKTMVMFGALSLPEHGQCWVEGNRALEDKKMTLEIKRASDRAVIATMELPSIGEVREGKIKVGRKTWVVRAHLRQGESGAYLALRLPEVKIASSASI